MKHNVVCSNLACDVKHCPYRWNGETEKEAQRLPLRYTSVCKKSSAEETKRSMNGRAGE